MFVCSEYKFVHAISRMLFTVSFSPLQPSSSPSVINESTLRSSKCSPNSGMAVFLEAYGIQFDHITLPKPASLPPLLPSSLALFCQFQKTQPPEDRLPLNGRMNRVTRTIFLHLPPDICSNSHSATWSFELINVAFNNAFAIANNVDPASNSITLTLPVVPVGCVFLLRMLSQKAHIDSLCSDGYTLQAVNIGNISDVFATTGDFSVGAASTTSTTALSTTTGTTGTKTGTVT
jgi:hypothetical protein